MTQELQADEVAALQVKRDRLDAIYRAYINDRSSAATTVIEAAILGIAIHEAALRAQGDSARTPDVEGLAIALANTRHSSEFHDLYGDLVPWDRLGETARNSMRLESAAILRAIPLRDSASPCREQEAYDAGRLAGYEDGLDQRDSATTEGAVLLREALKATQWGMSHFADGEFGGDHEGDSCPVCEAWKPGPHTTDCIVGRALLADVPDERDPKLLADVLEYMGAYTLERPRRDALLSRLRLAITASGTGAGEDTPR